MDAPVLVYTTWPDAAAADDAGMRLVAGKLCACVNILPGMVSIYEWQGRAERAQEVVMLIKTRSGLVDAVASEVRVMHPYDVPAILTIAPGHVDPPFAEWIRAQTGG
jgi:periplasmic divalent cation tolerance protein